MKFMYDKDHLNFPLCYFWYAGIQPVVTLLALSVSYSDHLNAYLFLLPIYLFELLSSITTSLYEKRKIKGEEMQQPGQLIQICKDFSYIILSLKSARDSWRAF